MNNISVGSTTITSVAPEVKLERVKTRRNRKLERERRRQELQERFLEVARDTMCVRESRPKVKSATYHMKNEGKYKVAHDFVVLKLDLDFYVHFKYLEEIGEKMNAVPGFLHTDVCHEHPEYKELNQHNIFFDMKEDI